MTRLEDSFDGNECFDIAVPEGERRKNTNIKTRSGFQPEGEKMTILAWIQKFRAYSGDDTEPYVLRDRAIRQCLTEALQFYSKRYPMVREKTIDMVPEKSRYPLPLDYQTWIQGLEGYDIVGNTILTEGGRYGRITFLYYGDRKMADVPERDFHLFYAYCQGALLEQKAMTLLEEEVAEKEIQAMKLGRGLELTFGEGTVTRKSLLEAAQRKKQQFFDGLKGKVTGGWY